MTEATKNYLIRYLLLLINQEQVHCADCRVWGAWGEKPEKVNFYPTTVFRRFHRNTDIQYPVPVPGWSPAHENSISSSRPVDNRST